MNKSAVPQAVQQEAERPQWKEKACLVTRYIPQYGILGFMFDDIPCQMNVANDLSIADGATVTIHYQGDIKTGLKFKL